MSKLTARASTTARDLGERARRLARRRWDARTILALKGALGLLVLGAVARHVASIWGKLREHSTAPRVAPAWIVLAVVLYLAGLTGFGVFFRRILQESATPVRLLPALRAYLISHLGKYVPGKAMVVVMRVGLVTGYGARAATAAFATLYETLVMMAAGSIIATLGFILAPYELWPIMVGLVLSLGLLVVVDPKVFPRLSRFASLPFQGLGPEALPRFSRRLLVEGMLWSLLGWVLLGLSQVAVIRALSPGGMAVAYWPLVIASVALATVAGFAIPILPGGLGVREWVLMTTLEPVLNPEIAVLAALALRLTWVVGEVIAAALLSMAGPRRPRTPSP